jgi:hypothetical protein
MNNDNVKFFHTLLKMQRLLWTLVNARKTKNTLRSVYPRSRIISHIDIHRAHFLTFTAGYTSFRIIFYSEQRKITCGFYDNGDRTDVFAKSAIVSKYKRKRYSYS